MGCSSPANGALTGEPASSPRNSPTCHCRASIHSGSRTWACRLRCMAASRGSGSRRVQLVIEGRATTNLTMSRNNTAQLLREGEIYGDGGALQVQGEVQ